MGISKTAGFGWTAVDRTTPVYTGDLASEVPLGTLATVSWSITTAGTIYRRHRIFDYPEPEKPIRDTLRQYQQMIDAAPTAARSRIAPAHEER